MNKYAITALACLSILVVGCKNLGEATKVLIQGTTNPTPLPETGPRDKEQIKQSIVKITSQNRQGTGFVVSLTNDTAYILTVSHVVAGDSAPSVEFLDETREFKAKVLENEPQENGISLLTVTGSIPSEAIPLYLVNNFDLRVGESVFTFGFPRGGGDWSYDELSYSSSKGREWLFSDSDIKEGNSGSPLMKGDEVIGMVTSTTDFAYAISAMSIREFLRGARGGEIVLSHLEKWQAANWRKESEARLKNVVKVTKVEPVAPTEPEEKLPKGIIIAFAVEPGQFALYRGSLGYGIYTKHLLQEMQKPQTVEELFKQVSESVRKTTESKQVPWYNASLSNGSFCFGGCQKQNSLNSVKQLALVIGRDASSSSDSNDANSMARALSEKGFEVTLQINLDFSEMNKVIQEFLKRLSAEKNGVGLFYFSGVGTLIDGKDYIVPVDVETLRKSMPKNEILRYLVSVDNIVNEMTAVNSKLNMVILDCHRISLFDDSDLEKFMSQLGLGEHVLIVGSHRSEEEARREAKSIKAKYPELFYSQKNNELTEKYREEGIYFDGKYWVVYIGGFYTRWSAERLLKKVTKELELPRKPFIYRWTQELPSTYF